MEIDKMDLEEAQSDHGGCLVEKSFARGRRSDPDPSGFPISNNALAIMRARPIVLSEHRVGVGTHIVQIVLFKQAPKSKIVAMRKQRWGLSAVPH